MARVIAIVGAGAKSAAIVARAAVLRYLGVAKVPEILVFEAEHIGAAWSGNARFSDGFLTLCTPAEKDVGYPYADVSSRHGKMPIGPVLFGRFSWSAYMVATGRMVGWIERGREHPSHGAWADYLKWVFSEADQDVTHARVIKIERFKRRWKLSFVVAGKPGTVDVDGVVLTGTGQAKAINLSSNIPVGQVLDAETFWAARNSVLKLKDGTIAVAGAGGAAGTIVAWLAERFAENKLIDIQSINPRGTLFPRGDGHAERRWFSDPTDWQLLSLEDREQILERTEAGVVSMRTKNLIDRATNVGYRWGRVSQADWNGTEIAVRIDYAKNAAAPVMARYLINAIGFDSWSLLNLVDHPKVPPLLGETGKRLRERVESKMNPDLTLPTQSGLPPGLHVPGLAGLARGPGMGNLGCLGLMATSVLDRYLK